MRYALTIFIFLQLLTPIYAQIGSLSSVPKTYQISFKKPSKKDREFRKAVKDSLRSAKKRYHTLQHNIKDYNDSISQVANKVFQDSLNQLKYQYLTIDSTDLKQYRDQLPDSSYLYFYRDQFPDIPDSTTIEDYKQQDVDRGQQAVVFNPEYLKVKQIQQDIGEIPNDKEEAESLIEQKAEEYADQFKRELTKQQKLELEYRKIIEERRAVVKAEKLQKRYEMMKAYADRDELKKQAEEELKKVAKDELSKVADEQMTKATAQLNRLKRKYGSFSSLEEVKKMKPYSLKNVPLKDRLDIGGSFQIIRGNPVSIDINPSITFWYNQRIALGAGGTYRLKVGKVDNHLDIDSGVYGFRAYGQYKLGPWFAHLEFEDMNKKFPNPDTDQMKGEWVPGLLLGVGKYFQMFRFVKGNVVVMYNFLHDPLRSPYQHPVIVRVGFGF